MNWLKVLLALLQVEAALCVAFGLWGHDWPLIIAGASCFAVWPLLGSELKEV